MGQMKLFSDLANSNMADIRSFIVNEYHKWMKAGYIDVYSMSVIQDKFEYYSNGQHFSYPDFIMVDKNEHVHIMEVKSLNGDGTAVFDVEAYREKIIMLGKCYLACSRLLPDYRFYIPVLEGTNWSIHCYIDGIESTITKQQFEAQM